MKIVIPTNGDSLESDISKSFGRAQSFIIADAFTFKYELVENTQNMDSAQGAGIQSAQTAVQAGGDILITLNCGPKAYRVLTEAGVRIYLGIDGSAKENIEAYNNGSLEEMKDANQESHWV
ncbi:MAG: NifB/NifX family molybdenum-iron cluster-binding protein [Clostridia bacterium]|nr:NifB/NifX family molybdenum-iron cluster-binding protein [Clostridia bacterium]